MGEASYRYDVNTYYGTFELKIALNEIKYPTEFVEVLIGKKGEFILVTRRRMSYDDTIENQVPVEVPAGEEDAEIPML